MPRPNPILARRVASDLATITLAALSGRLEELVLAPDAEVPVVNLNAYRSLLDACESLIVASIPVSHGAVSLDRALSGATTEARAPYDAAQHALRILERLHAPQITTATTRFGD